MKDATMIAPGHLRASTQGLYVMATTGLGNLLGSLLAGELIARVGGVTSVVFLAPVAINGLVLLALSLGFRWAVPAAGSRFNVEAGRASEHAPPGPFRGSLALDSSPRARSDATGARSVATG